MSSWRPRKAVGQEAKFGNEHSLCSLGHSHGSKLEGAVCQLIQLRERAGELKLLQVQDHVYLTLARIGYVPDFKCHDLRDGKDFWVEAKGYANDRWPIKKKLWKHYGPGKLEIWIGSHLRPVLDEVITPVGT